jgi:hypothetical protein
VAGNAIPELATAHFHRGHHAITATAFSGHSHPDHHFDRAVRALTAHPSPQAFQGTTMTAAHYPAARAALQEELMAQIA